MHNIDTVNQFRPLIIDAINEIFDLALQNQQCIDDIVPFLCNGKIQYGEATFGPGIKGLTNNYQDEFLFDFMNSSVRESIPKDIQENKEKERIERFTLNIELMIYTHLWEAESGLLSLKHLANYIEGKSYEWSQKIPRWKKNEFIKKIIKTFSKHNLKLAEILSEVYKSNLRNSFAHGQYGFFNEAIHLYKPESETDYDVITFSHWEKIFVKTVEVFYELFIKKQKLLKNYSIKNPELKIWIPIKEGRKKKRSTIYWNDFVKYYSFHPLPKKDKPPTSKTN